MNDWTLSNDCYLVFDIQRFCAIGLWLFLTYLQSWQNPKQKSRTPSSEQQRAPISKNPSKRIQLAIPSKKSVHFQDSSDVWKINKDINSTQVNTCRNCNALQSRRPISCSLDTSTDGERFYDVETSDLSDPETAFKTCAPSNPSGRTKGRSAKPNPRKSDRQNLQTQTPLRDTHQYYYVHNGYPLSEYLYQSCRLNGELTKTSAYRHKTWEHSQKFCITIFHDMELYL